MKEGNMEKMCSRRSMLHGSIKGAAGILLGSVLGSNLLTSCRKTNSDNLDRGINPSQNRWSACSDRESLNEEQKSVRASLKYVDSSPMTDRTCKNCKLYFAAESLCGGCKIIPGQVHPEGYCIAWLHRM
jgi:hypothetical protein